MLGQAKALTRESIPVRDRKVRCILYEVNAALLLCRCDWNSGCGTLPHALAPLSIDAEAILDLDQKINGLHLVLSSPRHRVGHSSQGYANEATAAANAMDTVTPKQRRRAESPASFHEPS